MSAATCYSSLPLKDFQREASEAILGVFQDTAAKIEADQQRRRGIALAQGTVLLRSPTGSGKTLTMGRTLECAVGALSRPTAWFWFAPYAGLVAQTREALMGQCPGLRIRDLRTDRAPASAHDGDVFVATWASVAAANKNARRVRVSDETLPGVDLLIQALRVEGWYIGAIIDEAHLHFGTGARQAADFYLSALQPDFTLLATATPKDEVLEQFERLTGMRVNHINVARDRVVRACLNKVGVKVIHFRPDPKDEPLLDMQEVAIYAGLARHRMLKEALAAAGVELRPLLMIQVENRAEDGPDPVRRAEGILKSFGMAVDEIAIHTSGEPDPHFHALAYDETKEALIFKMAAATGFDAPRAWTLVSLRKGLGAEFGLQVLGRIMRVHPRMQPLHPFASDPPRADYGLLDYGHVFLADPSLKPGMTIAAEELKALRDGIEMVTNNVVVVDFGGMKAALLDPAGGFAELLGPPAAPGTAARPNLDSGEEPDLGEVEESQTPGLRAAALVAQSALALVVPDRGQRWTPHETETGDTLTLRAPPQGQPPSRPNLGAYTLRNDIAFPRMLRREVMPRSTDGLVQCIARRISIDEGALNLVNRTRGRVVVTEEDLFGDERVIARQNVPLSNLRIAQQAQAAFRFNESIDDRDLKPALLERLRRELDRKGYEIPSERDLRRAVDLLVMVRPELLQNACRACLAEVVEIRQDEEIPGFYEGPRGLERASKNVYGVFPTDMNNEEREFARVLDEDETGTVKWWLRNRENTRWAVTVILPTGRRFFPDFVVGVDARRRTPDHISLAEVKDDGRTGRLYSTVNTDKVRAAHREYRSALMVFRNEQQEWFKVAYSPEMRGHVPGGRFQIEDLIWH